MKQMLKILGVEYITEKEAAERYGFSKSWFQKRRYLRLYPNYVKIHGKVLYDIKNTDNWFRQQIQLSQ